MVIYVNNLIETELILSSKLPLKKGYIFLIIILFSSFFALPYKYKTFINLNLTVKSIDNEYMLTTYIKNKDFKYLINNNKLIFNSKEYSYTDIIISEENYVDKDNDIVKLVYLKTDLESIYLIDNYILTAKIEKEEKMIISYILDYIKGEYNAWSKRKWFI